MKPIHIITTYVNNDIGLQGPEKIKDSIALKENDELLEWLLHELFNFGKVPHPHSRQVCVNITRT